MTPFRREPRNAQEAAAQKAAYASVAEEAGARVFAPKGWSDEGKELEIARLITAARQKDVYLAPRVEEEGLKLVDAWIDEQEWEFERVTPDATSWQNAVKQRLSDGKKQASRVVVYIDNGRHTGNEADRLINAGVQSAFFYDRKRVELRVVGMLNRMGAYQQFTREQILTDEKLFRLFSGRD